MCTSETTFVRGILGRPPRGPDSLIIYDNILDLEVVRRTICSAQCPKMWDIWDVEHYVFPRLFFLHRAVGASWGATILAIL